MVSFMVVVSLMLPFFGSMLPLAGGVMALALTSAVCVALTSGAWYGFIAFLIYITGLLVLFGYLLVVNPNTLTGTRFWFLAALPVPLKITQGASFSNSSGKVAELYEGGLVFYLFVSGLLFVVLVLTVVVSFKARKPMRSFLWPLTADLKSASEAASQWSVKLLNPFHLVESSPWPIVGSFGALYLVSGLALWFHGLGVLVLVMGLALVLVTMLVWWRDVVRESFQGFHSSLVVGGMRAGMLLFILSEVCFFFAFFWAYFHSSLSPAVELGAWPPSGVSGLSPWGVPLLNTVVLLSSGVSVTWCHHAILSGGHHEAAVSLLKTALLGVYFTYLQANEYLEASFSISDSVYGTVFFVATGFHGLHVLIGTTFLVVCLLRHLANHFTMGRHFGFEAAAWYWHFVDVVWLFLFASIYWWGF